MRELVESYEKAATRESSLFPHDQVKALQVHIDRA